MLTFIVMVAQGRSTYIATVVVLLSTFYSSAQQYTFKAMAVKGEVYVHDGRLHAGMSLQLDDSLKVGADCYVGLIHYSGKPFEIKMEGMYAVADLDKRVRTEPALKPRFDDLSPTERYQDRAKASPSMQSPPDLDDSPIRLAGVEFNNAILFTRIALRWCHEDQARQGPYQVLIESLFGDELAELTSQEPFIEIDLTDPKYNDEKAILLVVRQAKDYRSHPILLRQQNSSSPELVKATLLESDDPASWSELAERLADRKYWLNAYYAYMKAYHLSGDSVYYQKSKALLNSIDDKNGRIVCQNQ